MRSFKPIIAVFMLDLFAVVGKKRMSESASRTNHIEKFQPDPPPQEHMLFNREQFAMISKPVVQHVQQSRTRKTFRRNGKKHNLSSRKKLRYHSG